MEKREPIRTFDEVMAERAKKLGILRHAPWGSEDYFDARAFSGDRDSISFAVQGNDCKEYVASFRAVKVEDAHISAHLWEFTGVRLRSSYA